MPAKCDAPGLLPSAGRLAGCDAGIGPQRCARGRRPRAWPVSINSLMDWVRFVALFVVIMNTLSVETSNRDKRGGRRLGRKEKGSGGNGGGAEHLL